VLNSLTRALFAFLLFFGGTAWADVLDSPPFRIEFVKSDSALAERSAVVLQDALKGLQSKLPPGDEVITVIICHTIEEFTGYAGAFAPGRISGVAQSSRSLIAMKAPYLAVQGASEYEPTLRHELVHILLARNNLTVNMPRWLNEGLAMSLGREHGWNASFRVAQMYLEGQILTPRQLHVAFASSGSELEFGDAYAQSLSITRYLRKRLGEDAFWSLVTSLDDQTFSDALRDHEIDGIQVLWAEWQRSLWVLTIIFSVVSGFSIFQGAAFLTIWSYIRRRRMGKAKMNEWDREDGLDDSDPKDEYVEDEPYEWESYHDDDEELR